MSSYQSIDQTLSLDFNTRGAQALMMGDFGMARECFQHALQALEPGYNGKATENHPQCATRPARFEDRQCYIFNTPFVMDSSAKNANALRSAILFNLGLTFQAFSMSTTGDVLLLKAAMGYYDECLQTMDRERLVIQFPDMCIAALNNKASVFFEVGASNQGSKTLQLLNIMAQRVETKGQLTLTQDAMQGILFNIHYAGEPTLAAAA